MGKIFVRPRTATAVSFMANFKAAGAHRHLQFVLGLLANVRAQFALSDRLDKGAHFRLFAARLHLDPAVDEIAHPAGNIEPFAMCRMQQRKSTPCTRPSNKTRSEIMRRA